MTVKYKSFLEPKASETDSYAKVSIESYSYGLYIDLKIADCTRSVTLCFSGKTQAEKKKALRKLSKLQRALDIVKGELE